MEGMEVLIKKMSDNKQCKIGECPHCGLQCQLSSMSPTLQGDSVNLTFYHQNQGEPCECSEDYFTVLGKSIEYQFQEAEGGEKTNLNLFVSQYNKIYDEYIRLLHRFYHHRDNRTLPVKPDSKNPECNLCGEELKDSRSYFVYVCKYCSDRIKPIPYLFGKPMFKDDIHSCQICKEDIGEKDYSVVHSECLDNFDLDCPMFRMASFSEVVKNQKKQIQSLVEKYNSYKKYSSGKTEDLLEEIDYDITNISHFFDSILNYKE